MALDLSGVNPHRAGSQSITRSTGFKVGTMVGLITVALGAAIIYGTVGFDKAGDWLMRDVHVLNLDVPRVAVIGAAAAGVAVLGGVIYTAYRIHQNRKQQNTDSDSDSDIVDDNINSDWQLLNGSTAQKITTQPLSSSADGKGVYVPADAEFLGGKK